MVAWSNMQDETKDGILFGLALACNPKVTARREAYYAALRTDRLALAMLPRSTLEAAITERRLWTISGACERATVEQMVEAIARCMQSKDRPAWLAALGMPPPPPAD